MKDVTLGIIGAGRIGRLHASNAVRQRGVRVKAVSDINIDGVRDWATTLGLSTVVRDYHGILADPEIDAVLICASTDLHTRMIEEAAAAGKHIFCEKPLSFDLQSTYRALTAATQAGVHLQVGFNRRFDRNFARVRAAVNEGAIGQPHIIKITSRDPEPPSEAYIQVSGGIFMDMAIHDFDLARFLSGSEVTEVHAQGATLIHPMFAAHGDIDTAVTTLVFESGAIGVIDNSRKAVYGYDQRVEVFGSGGVIRAENEYQNTTQLMTERGVHGDLPKYFFLDRYQQAYVDELDSFVLAVGSNTPVPVSGLDGFAAELIAHAAKLSLLEHRSVRIAEIQDFVPVG